MIKKLSSEKFSALVAIFVAVVFITTAVLMIGLDYVAKKSTVVINCENLTGSLIENVNDIDLDGCEIINK